MTFDVGIDIGGTFTDLCAIGADGALVTAKTPTTHYDLSVGLIRGLRDLGERAGLAPEAFLGDVEALRYSTTIGTNALIERKGPRLGLITTAGFEDTIFIGRSRSWADGLAVHDIRDMATIEKPAPLIEPEMVLGLSERIDCHGNIVRPLDPDAVREQLQRLVDRGVQGIVVSLMWSFLNPAHEQEVRRIIEEEYPEEFLGSMPVTLASEVSPKAGEYTRTMTAVVNAYIHGVMMQELGDLTTNLRRANYRRPLILVHNTGGSKKVSRTRAVLTHNAGPVAGMYGAALIGAQEGHKNIIFADMGGTSFDIGVLAGGQLRAHDFIPVIDRWRTNIPAIEVKSIGAGGGSIAWINEAMGGQLEVGPHSAGSVPGPACYDQGGTRPTVTDADLVLGYINPDNYLGGKMLLDTDAAEEAIETNIAKPLGISVIEAAWRMRRLVDARMGQEIFNEVALKGHNPRKFAVFACGGAGAAHACGFARHVGAATVIVPAMSSVSGAFGASSIEIRQVWEQSRSVKVFNFMNQSYLDDPAPLNALVADMTDRARRDLKLEGFDGDSIDCSLEFDMRYGSQYNLTRIAAPSLSFNGADDIKALCDLFEKQYAAVYSPEAAFPSGGINIETVFVTARVRQEPRRLNVSGRAFSHQAEPAGQRAACFDPVKGLEQTPVFDWTALSPGAVIVGPAIIEAPDTTYVIEPGWTYRMNEFRNGIVSLGAQQDMHKHAH
ncbi:hydantoinase/oxoprolinase family protein [Martelella soudanensis]|uniref:hydantoinase/oxoprolinase family protein n=1 Tax=unclassified Martelella TaxID=2629616 RepID=UPI0015DD9312|nr:MULTISPECIES: hydantoinase/oxoprolinase family protein [unclassified Martelella]